MDGIIIISYFGGSNNIFADCIYYRDTVSGRFEFRYKISSYQFSPKLKNKVNVQIECYLITVSVIIPINS